MADTEQELIDLGSRWAAAMVSNDAGRIGSFMAADWVIRMKNGALTRIEVFPY